MDSSTAERWVVVSALIVIAVYGYRRIVEPVQQGNLKNIIGIGNPVPLAQFMTAWGFTYFVLAVAANASPGLGGSMAILIATGDLLTNAPAILGDVTHQEAPKTPTTAKPAATTQPKKVPAGTAPPGGFTG